METDIVVIGAGACGIVAGLRALEAGAEIVVLERDPRPQGSTALSSGFVPAPGTRFQKALGLEDSPTIFARDIQKKANDGADPAVVAAVTTSIGPALEWLADRHGIEWGVLNEFLYPGHSSHRMHAVPERTGSALMERLISAADAAGLTIVTQAHVRQLFTTDGNVEGVAAERPDGMVETLGCSALILACNGYGGNARAVEQNIPEIADALYFGHRGNTGDAIAWGDRIGAGLKDLSAYQGHGSVAVGPGVLISWALMMEGGIQVNAAGQRFSNEHDGYSEQAVRVLAQPGGKVWNIYDARIHALGMDFPDYQQAVAAGAVHSADSAGALSGITGLPEAALGETLAHIADCAAGRATDPFGRTFQARHALNPPFHAIEVTGALFHTQGGLCVDASARVLTPEGHPLSNLFAGGGAACGVSGSRVEGYLSGNGLLTAIALGDIAGREAARLLA